MVKEFINQVDKNILSKKFLDSSLGVTPLMQNPADFDFGNANFSNVTNFGNNGGFNNSYRPPMQSPFEAENRQGTLAGRQDGVLGRGIGGIAKKAKIGLYAKGSENALQAKIFNSKQIKQVPNTIWHIGGGAV